MTNPYANISYEAYKHLQLNTFVSYEGVIPAHAQAQREAIEGLFSTLPRQARILDLACGDGTGLHQFRRMGFHAVCGVEWHPRKATIARTAGYPVAERDMHELTYAPAFFDAVWASFAIEHAYDAGKVVSEIARVLRPGGLLFVATAYPNGAPDLAQGGKYQMGTTVQDGGRTCATFLEGYGFECDVAKLDGGRGGQLILSLTSFL